MGVSPRLWLVMLAVLVAWLPLVYTDIRQAWSSFSHPREAPHPSSRAGPKEWGWGRRTGPSIRHPPLHLSQNKPPLQWH